MGDDNILDPHKHQLISEGHIEEEGYLRLPLNEGQFRDFIKSLLGSPQAVTKTIDEPFEIDTKAVSRIHHTILQRVMQQNNGILIQFKAKIIFSDNSSVELDSIEQFISYIETKSVVSTALHLTWDFVIRFQDKNIPEKQRLQLTFATSSNTVEIDGVLGRYKDFINFRIEHTARTWAADIEALLEKHIKNYARKTSRKRKFIIKYSLIIGILVFILFFSAIIVGCVFLFNRVQQAKITEMNSILQSNAVTLESINNKINFVASFLSKGEWSQLSIFLVSALLLGFVLAVIFGFWTGSAVSETEPSFILLTDESIKDKDKTLNRMRKEWFSFSAAIIVSIIVNIFSNWVFILFFGT